MKIYHYHSITREYLGEGLADKDPMVDGNWLIPANATNLEPLPRKDGFTIVLNNTKTSWKYVEDNRGKTIYNTTTKESKKVDYLGEIESGCTIIEPTSEFDEWDGDGWAKNLDLAFNAEMNALNEKHYQDVLSATNQYNIAVARDGSTESDKVATARANLADIDAQFELDQLAIITKYYGA